MKKITALILALLLCCTLTGCGGDSETPAAPVETPAAGSTQTPAPAAPQETEEPVPEEPQVATGEVEFIDMALEDGAVKYIGWEKANPELTDYENAVLFKFSYTNGMDKPATFQQTFSVKYYQNGVELSESISYSSKGGEQYEMVGKFFDSAMKGGTVTFADIVIPEDQSPITIMVEEYSSFGEIYQMMEVDISGEGTDISEPVVTEPASIADDSNTVDSIDLSIDSGAVRYVGWEEANPGLTDFENAIIVKFDFTNLADKPASFQQSFSVKYFQNGAELSDSTSYSSRGGEQYEMVGKFFDSAMKGGTVSFADIVVPTGTGPIVIMVREQGVYDGKYQMMELDIGSEAAAVAPETEGEPAAEAETPAEAENSGAKTISIGDKIETADFDFTLTNVELSYEVKPRNTSGVYMSYTAPEGKVYIHIEGDYYNKSKKDVCIRDLFTPNADYDDGYTYKGFAVVDKDDNSFTWADSYVICTPLETCRYHGLIECPVIIDQTDAALFVTFTIGGVEYRYDIR